MGAKSKILVIYLTWFVSICSFANELSNYYQVEASSAPVERAQVLVIGETHNVPLDTQMEAEILTRFGRPGDVLLVEGSDASPVVSGVRLGELPLIEASSLMLVGGWDNLYANKATIDNYRRFQAAQQILDSPSADYYSKRAARIKIPEYEFMRDRLRALRNQSLREKVVIVSRQLPEARIFVIAGRLHVESEAHPELRRSLMQLNRPYAVLLPRQDNPKRIEAMSRDAYFNNLIRGG